LGTRQKNLYGMCSVRTVYTLPVAIDVELELLSRGFRGLELGTQATHSSKL
jgi:hypothetical protein